MYLNNLKWIVVFILVVILIILLGGVFYKLGIINVGQKAQNAINQTINKPISNNQPPEATQEAAVVCRRFTNLDEALKKIDKACALDLSNKLSGVDLSKITQLTKLTDLILKENKLISIPQEILSLNNLVVLDLSDNEIKEIPDAISNLKTLQVLNLSDNLIPGEEQEKIKKLLPQTSIQF